MLNFFNMLGYTNNALVFNETFNSSSNIFITDNPEFDIENDFYSIYPQFNGLIPEAVINMFYTVADASLKEKRFHESWKFMMCLYIAHLSTLYLQTVNEDPTAKSVIQQAMPKGIATSKSVDGLSISYDFMDASSDLHGYSTFKYTIYGQQLATYCKLYGHAGMWVNG